MRFLWGEAPAVRFVACRPDDAMSIGDDQIELLLDEGWRPEDLALDTTGSCRPEQVSRQESGNASYWDSSGKCLCRGTHHPGTAVVPRRRTLGLRQSRYERHDCWLPGWFDSR